MKIILLSIICALAIVITPAFGHGSGSEMLPPVKFGERDVTVFISISPSTFDSATKEHNVLVQFFDANTQAIIENVTYKISLSKDGRQIFEDKFFDELGNLYLRLVETESENIVIEGNHIPQTQAWVKTSDENPLTLSGNIISSGGLYKMHIEIIGIGSKDQLLEKPLVFDAAISIAEKISKSFDGSDGNLHTLGMTSYYDQLKSFDYNPTEKNISFSMPFDWSESNINQVSVVHEELHIPKSFGDVIAPLYDGYVNGIQLAPSSVVIDDYSSDDRIIHIIVPQTWLLSIKNTIGSNQKEITFDVHPSKETVFPLSKYTSDSRFKVNMSWEPSQLKMGDSFRFNIQITELFAPQKTQEDVSFDFVLKQNNVEILHKPMTIKLNSALSDNFIDYTFSENQAGSVTISIENINNELNSSVEFLSSVSPDTVQLPTFPLRLGSVTKTMDGKIIDGDYFVDLTWFSSPLKIQEESEFIITIYDKKSLNPISQATYDFVILQDNRQIFKTAGFAKSGGSFENYAFSESDKGHLTLRIENINQSDQFVEVPIFVTPEFPSYSMMIVLISLTTIMISLGFAFRILPNFVKLAKID